MPHKLDTDSQVFFYEQEFYCLSNFSSFTLRWRGIRFDTSEAAYHWEKFHGGEKHLDDIKEAIRLAPSAHEAFRIAQDNRKYVRKEWNGVKLGVMHELLRAKAYQHEYVRRKLLETGTRELVEDSWRDSYWGWGENRDGHNYLGKLWMMVRDEVRRPEWHIHEFIAPGNDDAQQCDSDCRWNWHKCKTCGQSRSELHLPWEQQ